MLQLQACLRACLALSTCSVSVMTMPHQCPDSFCHIHHQCHTSPSLPHTIRGSTHVAAHVLMHLHKQDVSACVLRCTGCAQNLHAAATAALSPDTEGGGGSTIPAACLQPLQTATAVIQPDSITLLPTVDIQARHHAHLGTSILHSSFRVCNYAGQQHMLCCKLQRQISLCTLQPLDAASANMSLAGQPLHLRLT